MQINMSKFLYFKGCQAELQLFCTSGGKGKLEALGFIVFSLSELLK